MNTVIIIALVLMFAGIVGFVIWNFKRKPRQPSNPEKNKPIEQDPTGYHSDLKPEDPAKPKIDPNIIINSDLDPPRCARGLVRRNMSKYDKGIVLLIPESTVFLASPKRLQYYWNIIQPGLKAWGANRMCEREIYLGQHCFKGQQEVIFSVPSLTVYLRNYDPPPDKINKEEHEIWINCSGHDLREWEGHDFYQIELGRIIIERYCTYLDELDEFTLLGIGHEFTHFWANHPGNNPYDWPLWLQNMLDGKDYKPEGKEVDFGI